MASHVLQVQGDTENRGETPMWSDAARTPTKEKREGAAQPASKGKNEFREKLEKKIQVECDDTSNEVHK